jgi:3alpha(or 20beta)-hydroxysteroid dehydrogenase
MGRVSGKVAIVTGAARGMGAAFAQRLVEEGAKVMLTDVLDEAGRATAQRLGDNARFLRHDVSSADEWTRVVQATEEAFGPVSVLVNNAGIVTLGPLETTDEATFRRMMDVNLVGTFLGMRSVIASMRKAGGGSMVNISSLAGMVGSPMCIAYAATKFGVRGMTKTAALELAGDKIRVNSVHPGAIQTPMTSDENGLLEEIKAIAASIPLGRVGQPQEVANLVLFLASDESSFSTGAEFIADGGVLAA